MTYLVKDSARFTSDFVDGFVAANSGLIRKVPGGVARHDSLSSDRVALVIGGGSGHYPAFAGLVGEGLADAAALGNVFASPSSQQVISVARSVAGHSGVLLSYGNYAGDVLNFDLAQEQLLELGIACRTVVVTDDVSSAPASERHRRRGVAGDLVVFRAAAWAAGQGRDLDAVYAVATKANERTRTFGVAFSGATLPGADAPLFSVPEGRMAVGLGIHGEPGIGEEPLPDAPELARMLLQRLVDERPTDVDHAKQRVGLILNGLGSVKGEELYVLYASLAPLLEEYGLTAVDPEVGEFATSFEMAGVSLTLVWLDDDLEAAWTSPANAPGFRKSKSAEASAARGEPEPILVVADEVVPASTEASRRVAPVVVAAVEAIRRTVDENVEELGRLDSIAGDGDHGIGMQRGATAAASAAAAAHLAGAGAGSVLVRAGDAWADRAGGTSGALWGAALHAAGIHWGDSEAPTAWVVAESVQFALDRITKLGGAAIGDKTMVDAIAPFAQELAAGVSAGRGLAMSWADAAEVARRSAVATADLLPRLGRARPHFEKSLGTPDPGATSFALAVLAVSSVIDASEGAKQ